MTIASTTNKVVANGNGSATSFSFSPMTIFEDTDMTVTLVDNLGVETLLAQGTGATNYAVVVASYPGTGSITYPASGGTPLASGSSIVMKPVLPLTQTMALTTQGPYQPDTQMAAFDRTTVIAQQQQEVLDRSLTLPIGVTGVSTQLPVPVATTLIGWANDGLSLINYAVAAITGIVVSAYAATLLVMSTAAAWRTGLGSTTVGDALFTAASAAAARTTLGLGTAATQNTGTSGATVPLLNAANTHSGLLTASAGLTVTTAGIQIGAPTGGDKGAGTTNAAAGLYDNGTRVLPHPWLKSSEYAPADQTITSGGLLTLAHGLGIRPKVIVITAIAGSSTEGGYSAGAEVDILHAPGNNSAVRGIAVLRDTTNITIRFGNDASPFYVLNSGGTAVTGITPANWTLRVRAYA